MCLTFLQKQNFSILSVTSKKSFEIRCKVCKSALDSSSQPFCQQKLTNKLNVFCKKSLGWVPTHIWEDATPVLCWDCSCPIADAFLDYEAWLFVTKVYKKKTSSQKIFIFWFQLLYPVVFPFKRISERFTCILLSFFGHSFSICCKIISFSLSRTLKIPFWLSWSTKKNQKHLHWF